MNSINNTTKKPSSRSNIKQSSSSSIRQSMNQRRHDLSSKIRKTRRTHHIQLKRRLGGTNVSASKINANANIPNPGNNGDGIQEVFHSFFTTFANMDNGSASGNDNATKVYNKVTENALNELRNKFLEHEATNTSIDTDTGTGTSTDAISKLLLHDHPTKGLELLKIFHVILTTNIANVNTNAATGAATGTDINKISINMKLQVLRILTNLAASATVSSTSKEKEEDDTSSYYGPSSLSSSSSCHQSWCELIICNMLSDALIPCLHLQQSHLQLQSQSYSQNDEAQLLHEQFKVISQTCWVIGNLAGDNSSFTHTNYSTDNNISTTTTSTTTRMYMIQQTNVITELIQVLKHSLHVLNQQQEIQQQQQQVMMQIIRNTLWALSNLARGSNTSSFLFLSNEEQSNTATHSLITYSDIISILEKDDYSTKTAVAASTSTNANAHTNNITWAEIHVEVYWLLAFLTAREDEVIAYLFPTLSCPTSPLSFLDMMAFHFQQVTQKILSSSSNGKNNGESDDNNIFNNSQNGIIIRMVIPILRIIGNIACATSGQFIPILLTHDPKPYHHHHQQQQLKIVHILSNWLYIIDHSPSRDIISISTEATWVCGALLCDAGYEKHPSTTIACPTLIPPLCQVLTSKSGNATLEWKREVLSALWNALTSPPTNNHNINMNGGCEEDTNISNSTIQVRDVLLKGICEKEGLLTSIVHMIQCSDVDAIQLSLSIINAVHRRILDRLDVGGNVKRVLDEADCLNILEEVCDIASANAQYGAGKDWNSEAGIDICAEMAANLIDDFYDEELDDTGMAMEASNGFAFEVKDNVQPFDFSGLMNHDEGRMTNMNTKMVQQTSTIGSLAPNGQQGRGRGRGRGSVTPAWMTRK
jgi:hypothetical protein